MNAATLLDAVRSAARPTAPQAPRVRDHVLHSPIGILTLHRSGAATWSRAATPASETTGAVDGQQVVNVSAWGTSGAFRGHGIPRVELDRRRPLPALRVSTTMLLWNVRDFHVIRSAERRSLRVQPGRPSILGHRHVRVQHVATDVVSAARLLERTVTHHTQRAVVEDALRAWYPAWGARMIPLLPPRDESGDALLRLAALAPHLPVGCSVSTLLERVQHTVPDILPPGVIRTLLLDTWHPARRDAAAASVTLRAGRPPLPAWHDLACGQWIPAAGQDPDAGIDLGAQRCETPRGHIPPPAERRELAAELIAELGLTLHVKTCHGFGMQWARVAGVSATGRWYNDVLHAQLWRHSHG